MIVIINKRVRTIFDVSIISTVLIFLLIFGIVHSNEKSEKASFTNQMDNSQSARLMAVGDNLIHVNIYEQAKQRGKGEYDFSFAYQDISHIIKQSDIAFINQETLLSSPPLDVSTYPCFSSPTQVGDEMIKMGFNVFNHSNNHVFDKGEKGVLATLDYYESKKDIEVIGVYRNSQEKQNIKIIEKNGIKFSFLGFTETTNGITLNNSEVKIINPKTNEADTERLIKKAKELSDIVVVSVHWGIEGSNKESEEQKLLAQKMVNWGAGIIIGTHPHVLQRIENIKSPDGTNAVVAFSLGNFISAQSKSDNMIGGILDVTVTKNNDKTSVSSVKFIPTITHYEMGMKNIRIIEFAKYNNTLAVSHGVNKYDNRFNYDFISSFLKMTIGENFLI